MTREEEIRTAVDTIVPILPSNNGRTYEQALIASGFEEGVKWADKNPKSPWISVDDDLPCNPKYLKQEELSPWVLVISEEGEIFFAQMMLMRGEWIWHSHFSREHNNICYWMMVPIPERFEQTWEIKQ